MKSHDIEYDIQGADIQMVDIILDPEETVVAEAGAMLAMDGCIEMKTSILDGSSKMSGLFNMGKRFVTGESLFFTRFTNKGTGKATVTFATPYMGRIVPVDLQQIGSAFLCSKGAFLCAAQGTDISIGFQKNIKSGLFGSTGFILQKIKGDGLAFLHSGGNLYKRVLKPGEEIFVDSEALIGFNEGIKFDLKFVKGVRNMLFSGEGMFLYKITGPGIVLAQSFNFKKWTESSNAHMAEALNQAVKQKTSEKEQ
ncbi:AIM24 family protein [Bacillus toyonensis]|uniref:AIM24 family protein n=1 Tax=Bacillus toyonensis TaxID=155322 RepID=UPI002E1BF755|nr:AIM24 family protein [Bacillus toyonensis]